MNHPTWAMPRVSKLRITLVGALIAGVVGVVSLPSAQAVEGGDAMCDALDVALFAAVTLPTGDQTVLDVSGGTDDVVAPDPENGTNTGGASGEVTIGDDSGSVTIDLLTCEATRATDFLSAEAEIVGGDVTLAGVEVVTVNAIMSEVLCPAAGLGAPTASASANLTVGGEVIDLDTDTNVGSGAVGQSANVAFAIPGVADGVINVAAGTSATADDDSANAVGLELTLTFSGALLGQSVTLALGTITLAETSCNVGQPDQVPPTTPTTPPTTEPTEPTTPPTEPTTPTTPTTDDDDDDGDDDGDVPGGTLPPTR